MAKDLPPMLRQYDRLAAVTVLAALMVSLCYLIFAGLNRQKKVQDYELGLSEPNRAPLKAADMDGRFALLARADKPGVKDLLTPPEAKSANLFTPESRLLCVKCAYPIPFASEKCPFCRAEQPTQKSAEPDYSTLDSDDDGMTDLWEIKYGLDPTKATDADLDADKDGFTNLEEFMAKTDPTDPKSHPAYTTRMRVTGFAGTKLPLRAVNVMNMGMGLDANKKPVARHKVTFVRVAEDGTLGKVSMMADPGQEIGTLDAGTGYRFVRYNAQPKKQIRVVTQKASKGRPERSEIRFVDVSTVELQRISDGKVIATVFYDPRNPDWPGDPLLEQKATIAIDLAGEKERTVAPTNTLVVKGEVYTVTEVNADAKTVTLKKKADNKVFVLK